MKQEIQIKTVRALKDNYCYVIHRLGSRKAVVIDVSEAGPIEACLEANDLELGLILNTHHHHDHVDGNLDLVADLSSGGSSGGGPSKAPKIPIYCSAYDLKRVPGATRGLSEGERFEFDGFEIDVLEIPGHTQGQIAFYLPEASALFVGDTVFSMGCGRLLEGTPEQMFASLQRISNLDPETRIFFGHEYTENNARFALSVEPGNSKISARVEKVRHDLSQHPFSEAPTLERELEVNPFLRTSSPEIRSKLGLESATDLDVFSRLRELRNTF